MAEPDTEAEAEAEAEAEIEPRKGPVKFTEDGNNDATLSIKVPGDSDDTVEVSIGFHPGDAVGKNREISVSLTPWPTGDWETIVDLNREDARLIRDFLSSILQSPIVEEAADGEET